MKKILLALILLSTSVARADINWGPFTVSGYSEFYIVQDFIDFPTHNRMVTPSGVSPIFSYNKAEIPDVNLALLDVKFATNWVRAAVGLSDGTYVQQNYAPEKGFTKYIYEASGGVKLAENLWMDGGVFPSHIGLETPIGKDNANLTRSLMADNTPYYESGGKLTWDPNTNWLFCVLVLRGWQSIDNPDNNVDFGSQIQFKPNDSWLINSSTFIGGFGADHRMRYFHDLYATWQVCTNVTLSGALDAGFEQVPSEDNTLREWFSTSIISKYQFAEKWALGGRVEYYHDPNGLTVFTATPNNFVAGGGSVNVDYQPWKHVLLRTEYRNITSGHPVFIQRGGGLAQSDNAFAWSVCVFF